MSFFRPNPDALTPAGALSYLIMAPLLVLAVARIAQLETGAGIVAIESTFPYIFLPVYVIAIFAIVRKRLLLTLASLFLIACHLSWTTPELLDRRPLTNEEKTAPSFRIFSHNIKFDNETPERLGGQILATNPDIVFLQELTWDGWQAVEESGALANYRYHHIAEAGTDGLGLWSKTPLKEAALVQSPGFPYIRAVTTIQGKDVVLYNVHTRAPVNGDVSFWHGDLSQLQNKMSNEDKAVLAAGDFNATYQHRPFRAILDSGFRDATVATGRGYARTWPVTRLGGSLFGGYIRLDHVLISGELAARDTREMRGAGSDHRAIVADIVFASAPS